MPSEGGRRISGAATGRRYSRRRGRPDSFASDREPDPPSIDPVSDLDDAMLERLEADLATIEAAMDRVDSGDLEGYGAVAARLDDEISDST